ncbi:ATP-binding protein [Herbiconiux sp. CPCC 205763]|uniref:ATP-binding protein n=1 Tax=Herbiconiux aconitum TaxID=2970913 RepID=A0ABT2GR94_9MICO|nr:ATP-binding protein [Herbiconiux aconitum]MCS5718656.1 ATP-binding protein [Herbiconiux aconitum]
MTVILIDGPSGSGKTLLALRMRDHWVGADRPTLVHLDDVYPGWDGLDAAGEQVNRHLLEPLRAGLPARWQRYDWTAGEPAEWHDVDPSHPLIVEGCGALTRSNRALADLAIWVETDDETRKARAIARDGESYLREWDRWDAQWRAFVRRENPRELATMVVPT